MASSSIVIEGQRRRLHQAILLHRYTNAAPTLAGGRDVLNDTHDLIARRAQAKAPSTGLLEPEDGSWEPQGRLRTSGDCRPGPQMPNAGAGPVPPVTAAGG